MTVKEWLAKVSANYDELEAFVIDWHPQSQGKVRYHELRVTAPNAERASEIVRQEIQRGPAQATPAKRLRLAVAAGDVGTIDSLLNGAWFGVPESTSAWNLTGFKEAVDLMEDLPEEEE